MPRCKYCGAYLPDSPSAKAHCEKEKQVRKTKKCRSCGDPILNFQNTDVSEKYHKGCEEIKAFNESLLDPTPLDPEF